ncbi:MAG: hypothetical protein ABFD97_24795 [Syntrophobacter sp.]
MERRILTRQHRIQFATAFLIVAGLFAVAATCLGAAESAPAENVQQTEVTVIHVDQYAVYAPNRIFYFDTRTDKRKIASMMRTADQLRNRKAAITYSSTGDPAQNKHVYLVDIVPAGEKPLTDRPASPTREARETAGGPQDRPARASSGEAVTSPAEAPSEARDLSWQTAPREKAPRRQGMEARTPTGTPDDKTARTASAGGVAPPVNDLAEPRVSSRQPTPQERTQARTADSAQPITRQEITAFVRNILELNGKKDLPGVLPFYADKVDYYDRGVVNRDYVRRDLGYYFQNWDSITTALDGDVVMIVLDQPEERTAKFVSRFSVRNDKKSVTGRTENIWRIQRINGQLRLVGVRQKIISKDQ